MYEGGDRAFGNQETSSQRCFICRSNMDDKLFSQQYFKLLHITQVFCMGKKLGHSNDSIHKRYHIVKPLIDDAPPFWRVEEDFLDNISDSSTSSAGESDSEDEIMLETVPFEYEGVRYYINQRDNMVLNLDADVIGFWNPNLLQIDFL
jgi:hypothetical protein